MRISKTTTLLSATLAAASAAVLAIMSTGTMAGCNKDDAEARPAASAAKVNAVAAVPAADALPTVDQVLAKHFAALGGESKLRAAQTLSYRGTVTKGDQQTTVAKYYQRGHKLRVEKDDGEQKVVMVFNGDAGFKRKGDEVVALTGDKAAYMKHEANIDDALLTYQQDGHALRLVGMAEVNGAPAYELELTKGEHGAERRYIDAGSHYEVKRVVTWKGEDGVAGNSVILFSDYRDVGGGMMINHRVDFESDKGSGHFIIEQAAYNQPLDGSLFNVDEPVM